MLNERERELVLQALYMLEGGCHAEELDFDTITELGGTPDPDEVRELMERLPTSNELAQKIADWLFTKMGLDHEETWSGLDRDMTVEALKKLLR